jgi:hypothetical protein
MLCEGTRRFHCSKVGDDLWAHGLLQADSPISHFGEFASLVGLWRRFGAGRGPDCIGFRDPFVLRSWIGRIAIDEVTHDPFDMHCVLFGVTASEICDGDQTRKRLSDFLADPEERDYYRPYLEFHARAAEEHAIVIAIGSMLHRGRMIATEWIGLPCADDGERVSHFVSVVRAMPIVQLEDAIAALRRNTTEDQTEQPKIAMA